MIAPAPVIEAGQKLRLDVKFVEGMRMHQAYWPSRITCMLRRSAHDIPFGRAYDRADLPFDLVLLDPSETIGPQHLAGYDLIYGSGDDFLCLGLADLVTPEQKIVYVTEYTDETRRQILELDRTRGFLSRLRGRVWLMLRERQRRHAFRKATALQLNGYPAYDLYGPLSRDSLLFLDGRMTPQLFATEEEMVARERRRAKGAPLRLIYSGRLETMKGAQDLISVAQNLEALGVDFTLDIFGSGSLESEIRAGLATLGTPGRVCLHGAVDFESELVPFTRRNADVFLGCHRQSDPSCTYIEAMGCGVAVASYDNRMWQLLNSEAKAGWGAPLGQTDVLATVIARIASDPSALDERCRNAWNFSRAHSFEYEFQRRMEHLARIAGVTLPASSGAGS